MVLHKQRGVSLIEVVVSSLLASWLMLSITSVYQHVKSAWIKIDAQSDLSQRERVIRLLWQRYWANSVGGVRLIHGYDGGGPRYWRRGRLASSSLLVQHSVQGRRVIESAWFVANTRRKDRWGHAIYALYFRTRGQQRQELIDGVIRMKLHYKMKGPLGWVWGDAATVTQWGKVRAVRISLLLRSLHPVYLRSAFVEWLGNTRQNNTVYQQQVWVMVLRLPHVNKRSVK